MTSALSEFAGASSSFAQPAANTAATAAIPARSDRLRSGLNRYRIAPD
jgi:hypothetical protein